MKGKFGIAALIFSSITFAAPVSTPNQMSDTPIISGGGTVSSGTCRAYQTDGTVVNLSGGETLVFYGGGADVLWTQQLAYSAYRYFIKNTGGYLSTKSTYSGTAYVKTNRGAFFNIPAGAYSLQSNVSPTLGLFTRNSTSQADFIAGVGGAGAIIYTDGGGWNGKNGRMVYFVACYFCSSGGSVNSGSWFTTGFHGSVDSPYSIFKLNNYGAGGSSSISAFYNYYTKQYTSVNSSYTLTGGGIPGYANPVLYVCK